MRKQKNLVVISLLVCMIMLAACGEKPQSQTSTNVAEETLDYTHTNPKVNVDKAGNVSISGPDKEIFDIGNKLLKEYEVKYNQSIRFPHEGIVYETTGAYPLTSVEEIKEKHSDFFVPQKLGDFDFVDLTLNTEKTQIVFPDIIPKPVGKIVVLEKEPKSDYYLCYKNSSLKFRAQVLPMSDENLKDSFNDFIKPLNNNIGDMVKSDKHQNVYFVPEDEEKENFNLMIIAPESDGEYAFFVNRLSGEDCLEAEITSFSKTEAGDIYTALTDNFMKK